MMQRIGTCSICGGDVIGEAGPRHCVLPPPPPRCASCGAIAGSDVIYMIPSAPIRRVETIVYNGHSSYRVYWRDLPQRRDGKAELVDHA